MSINLRFLSQYEWRQLFPNDAEERERVAQHFDVLLSDPDRFKSLPISSDIVAQARFALQTASLPVLMYSRLKLSYPATRSAPSVWIYAGSRCRGGAVSEERRQAVRPAAGDLYAAGFQ